MMEFPCRPLLVLMVCVTVMHPAVAGDWTGGVETPFDRALMISTSRVPRKINAARTFATGVVLGGLFEPQIKSHSHDVSYNLESTFGCVWKLGHFATLGSSAGHTGLSKCICDLMAPAMQT